SATAFGRLATLDLSSNGIGGRGARSLAASPTLANLTTFYLMYNRVGDEGAVALAGSAYLARLTALDLRLHQIGAAGATRLAGGGVGGLRSLVIWGNAPGRPGRDALRRRFGDRVHF